MRKITPVVALAAALAAAVPATAESPPGPGFGWFASLTGACWEGVHPGGKTRDTQCYQWQFGRYIRGTIQVAGTKPDGSAFSLSGDSVFQWLAKDGRIRYANWADRGDLQQSEAYFEGGLLVFPDVKSRDDEPVTRSVWRQIDKDRFEVTRERRGDSGWTADYTVTYKRSGAAPVPEDAS